MRRETDLQDTLNSVSDVLRDLRVNAIERRGGSNIMINGGSVGVWIATVCCALMLGISIVGAMVIIDQSRQISDLRDYLSAIYAQAPHLKAKAEEESP